MENKLLLKLADLLDRVPDDRFNMGHFGKSDYHETRGVRCATSACALGWATTMPECKRAGLELRARDGDAYADIYLGDECEDGVLVGRKLFGLTAKQSDLLFYGPTCSPKAKATQIRQLVGRGG